MGWMRLAVLKFVIAVSAVLLAAITAQADVIVLKNGRRITGANVVEEGDRVHYETSAGRMSLPRSLVARIERSDSSSPVFGDAAAAEVPPPEIVIPPNYEEIVRAVLAGGSVDRNYIARLEQEAGDGGVAAGERVVAAHHAAAQHEAGRGRTDEAIAHYRRALRFVPEHLGALLNIAYLHLRRSEFTPALDFLERGRRFAPDSADVAKLTGWAYYGQNKIELAVREWRRALALRPDADVERALARALRDESTESSYREGESRHFVLRYHGDAAPDLARQVLRALEDHFRSLEVELNFIPRESIGVILYTDRAFADITRAPGWVGAINDGRIRIPVQGLTSVDAELSRILKHELTHSFISQKTRDRCPVWLNEGIAQWMEGQRAGEHAYLFARIYEQGRSLPLGALEGSFLQLPAEAAELAYAWSLAVVEYIVRTYGITDIERILERIAAEPRAEDAVRSVMRMSYPELEQESVNYLKRTYLR